MHMNHVAAHMTLRLCVCGCVMLPVKTNTKHLNVQQVQTAINKNGPGGELSMMLTLSMQFCAQCDVKADSEQS